MLATLAATAAISAAPRHSYATAYCLHGTMANGRQTHRRAIAHNFLFPGTKIRLTGRSFYGLRLFVVSDTGPALRDGHFDIWTSSCSRARQWGRRSISFKLGWDKRKAEHSKPSRRNGQHG